MRDSELFTSLTKSVSHDLASQGWSHKATDVDPEDVTSVHALFEAMNLELAKNASIPLETTTLAPREHSQVLATSREAMSYHTDNVYLDDPCRTVALFCTVQAEVGGENELVDALATSASLPEETIAELKRNQWRWTHPKTGNASNSYRVLNQSVEQIRWWRMSLLANDLAQVAIADSFESALNESPTRRSLRMQPGDILVTDNTRIVHNRAAFSGARHLYRARFW